MSHQYDFRLTCHFFYRCLHTEDEYFLRSMKEAIHEILTDLSDSFSHMIDMALANEIQVHTLPTESRELILDLNNKENTNTHPIARLF